MNINEVKKMIEAIILFNVDEKEFYQSFNSIRQLSNGNYLIMVSGVRFWFNKDYEVYDTCYHYRHPFIAVEDEEYKGLIEGMKERGII